MGSKKKIPLFQLYFMQLQTLRESHQPSLYPIKIQCALHALLDPSGSHVVLDSTTGTS